MKKTILLILVISLFFAIDVNATPCWQEFANQSTITDGNCSLSYNGRYGFVTFEADYQKMVDGDYATTAGLASPLHINYSKPSGGVITGINWTILDGYGKKNVTIPPDCFDNEKDYIDLFINESGKTDYYCWNFTGNQYSYINGTNTGTKDFTEESIYWNLEEMGLDNCSTYTNEILNISITNINNEETNVDLEATVLYLNAYYPHLNYNYSFSIDNDNFTQLCISEPEFIINLSTQIQYSYEGIFYEYNYKAQSFNGTNILNLYVDNATSQVVLTVTDYNDNPVQGAIIKILKYDVGEGAYKTTEILETDDNGQTIANLILIDAWYKFIIDYDSITRLIEPETGGIRILSTTKNFQINLGAAGWFDSYDVTTGISSTLSYNNATDTFSFTWNDPSSEMHYGCLRIVKRNSTQEKLLTDNCTLSTAASIVHTIIPQNGSSFHATGYFKFDNEFIDKILVIVFEDLFAFNKIGDERDSLFMGTILMTGFVLVGLPYPVVALFMMGIALIVVTILGMFKMGMGLAVGVILLIFLHWFKMRKS